MLGSAATRKSPEEHGLTGGVESPPPHPATTTATRKTTELLK
jgi:hypothetical protein